jgi:hypothetical protein
VTDEGGLDSQVRAETTRGGLVGRDLVTIAADATRVNTRIGTVNNFHYSRTRSSVTTMPTTFLQAHTGEGDIVFYSPAAVDYIGTDDDERMIVLRNGHHLWTPMPLPELLAILNGQEVR